MHKLLLIALVLCFTGALLLSTVDAAYCHGAPHKDAKVNNLPFLTAAPSFVKQVKNGKLFTVGDADNQIKVAHVYGSAYEMGFAHGTLLKEDLNEFFPKLWSYILSMIGEAEKSWPIPEWMKKLIAEEGIDVALDLTYEATVRYTGAYIYEEMKGIADAAGLDIKMLRRVHLIGELTKGHCSMLGAWGQATTQSSTVQLRAFDWDVQGPYRNFPAIIVYHPTSGNGHAFANIGFVGWIGAFSGMSSTNLGISEIGVSYPDDTFGSESRIGIPFTFILRDILQFDKTLDDATSRFAESRRTCNLILGVGDGKLGQFRAYQYSHTVLNVIDDINLKPRNDTWHWPIKNVVYYGMDWLCPSFTQTLGQLATKYWGSINAENLARNIVPITTTGNLQVSIYDFDNNRMFVSYARKESVKTGDFNAYDRPYIVLNTTALWIEPAPQV